MKRKTVSLCVIARDEEASIGMTIKSVLALVDEVIVVDTGSRDNTRIIAEGYGARVIDVAWEDDFSAVRNMALNEATCDWVLVLDADEYLQPVRPVEFQRLLHDPAAAGYRLRMISTDLAEVQSQENRVRLFRNSPEVRYQYPIHERIMPALGEWAARQGLFVIESQLAIMHEPRDGANRTEKRQRNQRILGKAVLAYPDEPYFPYQLACGTLVSLDGEVLPVAGTGKALVLLQTAWDKVHSRIRRGQQNLPWLPDLGSHLVSTLLALDRVDEAREISRQLGEAYPDHSLTLLTSVMASCRYLEGPSFARDAASKDKLIEQTRGNLEQLIAGPTGGDGAGVDSRLRDLYPLRFMGELALMQGHVTEAVGYYERALNLDPEYSHAWLGMAECSRTAGDCQRALKLYLRTVTLNADNHRAWIRGCELMREMGFMDNAASWWQGVAERFPEHPQVTASSRPVCETV